MEMDVMKTLRLDKFLCDALGCTRSEARKMIRQGRVLAGDEIIKKPEHKVNPEEDEITADGQKLNFREYEYLMMNKPKGVVTATKDGRDKTVMDLITGTHRKGPSAVSEASCHETLLCHCNRGNRQRAAGGL